MSTSVQYKALPEEQQPQPQLPAGYGVVKVIFGRGTGDKEYTRWFPCRLLTIEEAKTLMLGWHSFYGSYSGGPLAYKDRRKAIDFVWRWHRRYGEDGLRVRGMPCGAGIPGHLYQGGRITIAEAAERLGLSTKDIHWIRKHADLKARLESGKISRGLFYNHYTISLALLQAYLDTHGYKGSYVNVAELRKQRPSLPYVVWCV